MKRKVVQVIDNCCDCGHSYTEQIVTSDLLPQKSGLFCGKMYTGKLYPGTQALHKCICTDDWDLRKNADIPDWCPLLPGKGRD